MEQELVMLPVADKFVAMVLPGTSAAALEQLSLAGTGGVMLNVAVPEQALPL
jgi:hypothetical protein